MDVWKIIYIKFVQVAGVALKFVQVAGVALKFVQVAAPTVG